MNVLLSAPWRLQQEGTMNTADFGGLMLAGHPYPNALGDVRRFCGLSWSGGMPGTSAFGCAPRVCCTLIASRNVVLPDSPRFERRRIERCQKGPLSLREEESQVQEASASHLPCRAQPEAGHSRRQLLRTRHHPYLSREPSTRSTTSGCVRS